ncbi:DUF1353 domain-containing protein [Leptothoe spongobia]|uniref:DUF1353 domain-containing protein n=1 Tax=Leptothoe spongobia TAU-MAC 1115 TaxID=1967444 RepID=A0A947DE16_9CYAN|nr:DUF1353 domain-containing protein [Leptothoe spongobia]MBT9315323.1 DUF1353 domain-containing protein [Leptothoe spongobia TAU-MAC 1115]
MYQPKIGKLHSDGKPVYQSLCPGKKFKLDEWWVYEDHHGQLWVIPPGFVYDLASIPSWMAGSLQWGVWNVGAVPHDWAYEYGYLLRVHQGRLEQVFVTKRETDDLFADIMFSVGRRIQAVRFWRMGLIYWAVRLLGRGVWLRGRRASQPVLPSLWELQRAYDRVKDRVDEGQRRRHLHVA